MTKEKIEEYASDVFLGTDEDYQTRTSFEFINWKEDNFGFRIVITNIFLEIRHSRLLPTIDYLIEILKNSKQLSLLIKYKTEFKYYNATQIGTVYSEIAFYFFFEKTENV